MRLDGKRNVFELSLLFRIYSLKGAPGDLGQSQIPSLLHLGLLVSDLKKFLI